MNKQARLKIMTQKQIKTTSRKPQKISNHQKMDKITDILSNLLKSQLAPKIDLQVLEAQELALEVRNKI